MKALTIDPAWQPIKLKTEWTVEMSQAVSTFHNTDYVGEFEKIVWVNILVGFLFEYL